MGVERALLSVFDKTGIVELARRLAALKIEIVSTGGTAKLLREAGCNGARRFRFDRMAGDAGRAREDAAPESARRNSVSPGRTSASIQEQAEQHGIAPIDLVVVNLYPFEATAAKPDLTPEELIENIDIGGPTMVRSAAKNFESVAVVTDPADYGRGGRELRGGRVSLATRLELARKAFALTARYDGRLPRNSSVYRLASGSSRTRRTGDCCRSGCTFACAAARNCATEKIRTSARRSTFRRVAAPEGLAAANQLQGKELSYNNLVDLEAARTWSGSSSGPPR